MSFLAFPLRDGPFVRLLAVLSLLLLSGPWACGEPPPDPPSSDASTPVQDPGVEDPRDAGREPDAGGPRIPDAGMPADAGAPPADAGTPADAGAPPAEVDAGTLPDAGAPQVDAGPPADAGTPQADAGTDGGSLPLDGGASGGMDGGVDGGSDAGVPACGAGLSGPWGPRAPGDPSVVADTTRDMQVRLRAVPGVLSVEEQPSSLPGYRRFLVDFDQPADHARPDCQRFTQQVSLLHVSSTAPMVLSTSGYYLSTYQSEPAALLTANQLSIEHRFFPPSIPSPANWEHLTLAQSAADSHRIVEAFKPLYTGKWLSTGISKGGETAVFHRRFYPQDLDGTVAYVAPIARADDARFVLFQESVGGSATADCRERIRTFQRTVLERRSRMTRMLIQLARREQLTFTQLSYDMAIEHAVIDVYFGFWQYEGPSSCNKFPGATASDETLFNVLNQQAGLSGYSNQGIAPYWAYYHQASVELGWPYPYETALGGLIQYPGTGIAPTYAPPGPPLVFRPRAMQDVQDWVSTRAERMMFIYGSLDPWTAAAYQLGSLGDSYLYMVPGGNHGSSIGQLPEPRRAEARATLRRWAGGASVMLGPSSDEPRYPEFGPHLPPHLRP